MTQTRISCRVAGVEYYLTLMEEHPDAVGDAELVLIASADWMEPLTAPQARLLVTNPTIPGKALVTSVTCNGRELLVEGSRSRSVDDGVHVAVSALKPIVRSLAVRHDPQPVLPPDGDCQPVSAQVSGCCLMPRGRSITDAEALGIARRYWRSGCISQRRLARAESLAPDTIGRIVRGRGAYRHLADEIGRLRALGRLSTPEEECHDYCRRPDVRR